MSDSYDTSDLAVAFVLEQHLGHRTFAQNLRAALPGGLGVDPTWWTVAYDKRRPTLGLPLLAVLPDWLGGPLAGRAEVRESLRQDAEMYVFNTQVPVALGGRRARSRPYIVITDVTPVQYDQIGERYGHRPDRRTPMRWWKQRINKRVFNDAAHCVAWSTWAARSIVEDYEVHASQVSVIPPGVDLSKWKPSDRSGEGVPQLLFVGGDFVRKGGNELMQAFSTLRTRAELTVVTRSDVRSADRVRVIRDLGPNDPSLVDLYRSCDLFVLPSHAETFGIAAAEASAVGLPVVASGLGGLADIVLDGRTGLTVPAGDVDALVTALAVLIDDAALRRRYGAAARHHAEQNFDAARNASKLFWLVHGCARDPLPVDG